MNELSFRKMTANDRGIYEEYYRKSNTRLTDMTFNCRIAWDVVFKSEIAIWEDACLLISDGAIFTDPHLLMPMGILDSDKLDRILLAVKKEFDRRGWRLKVMCIDEEKVPLFENLKHFKADPGFNENSSDYLYDGESMRTLSGNQLHKKRNHVNKFMRLYPGHTYSRITKNDMDDCMSLVAFWCESKGIDKNDIAESDYMMIKRLFENFELLDLRGGLIRTDGIVRAFALGSLGNRNCAYIHFEKADSEIDGIYSAINQMVLKNEFPGVSCVNREEDLGLPGLRKAKQSYEPVELLKKYKTWLEYTGNE